MIERTNEQIEFKVISSSQYAPHKNGYDEFVHPQGDLKDVWKNVWPKINQDDIYAFQKRQVHLEDIIKENGITYNIHNQHDASSRLWMMDLLPIILKASELIELKKGLNQRFRLLNAIIKDFYGAQRLLKNGIFPAKLLLGNPSFLRPCNNLLPEDQQFLHFYATDLARSSSGDWWVMSDRVDAASGIGYAMENRFISNRVFTNVLDESEVLPIKSFLDSYRESLASLVPESTESPLIVVLTPGPWSETYFEHSYLAKTMGFQLVQGTDLTVRDQKLYLKTIEGLQQVHVVLRRLDSEWCDPLELRDDSLLGIPGLMQVIRNKNVVMSNYPGCAIAESPALLAFLPSMCQALFDEELQIPSVATWWCGQAKERDYVLDSLEKLIIKPAFGHSKQFRPIYCEELGREELLTLKQEIHEKPDYYCAQQSLSQSTTPIFNGYGLEPREFLIRAFLYDSGDESISILPGGLGRVSGVGPSYDFSMQQGGKSKDVWVIKDSESENLLSRPTASIFPNRSLTLSSYLADNLYWLGRYAERAEVVARTVIVVLKSVLEESNKEDIQSAIFLMLSQLPEAEKPNSDYESGNISQYYDALGPFLSRQVSNDQYLNSLLSITQSLQRTKSIVKERISGNTSKILMSLDRFPGEFHQFNGKSDFTKLYKCLVDFLDVLSSFSGMIAENITRGPDWYFLNIGKRLERSFGLSDLLGSYLSKEHTFERGNLRNILDYADSSVTYRQRYLNNIQTSLALELIARDQSNPRALAFQVHHLKNYLAALPNTHSLDNMADLESCTSRLLALIHDEDFNALLLSDDLKSRESFIKWNKSIYQGLIDYSDLITKKYFVVT